VPKDQWYYNDVKIAYETELINGTSPTTFTPDRFLKFSEAIKLAACMNQRYLTGEVTLQGGTVNWYDTFVKYCKDMGIITRDYSWDEFCTAPNIWTSSPGPCLTPHSRRSTTWRTAPSPTCP
jgi:hypothetical protein